MDKRYISVLTLNKYIRAKMERDISLQNVYIKGEISNYRPHPSGHLYFTLKDEHAKVSAIMFASAATNLPFRMENGIQVLVQARVSVYEVNGQYQIIVNKMEQDGIGKLFYELEMLKKRLDREGLFDRSHKKPIPKFPSKIAVLSGKGSAAVNDVVKTLQTRFPFAKAIVFPIPVQSVGAYKEIVKTLQYVDILGFDTIILARGGGSIEELWNFNEEELAYCIYNLRTPLITGIGHEIDYTICELVADFRAITPTEAAIAATPDQNELKKHQRLLEERLMMSMRKTLEMKQQQLHRLSNSYYLKNPEYLYSHDMLKLTHLNDQLLHQFEIFDMKHSQKLKVCMNQLEQQIKNSLQQKDTRLQKNILKLDALSPLKVMHRGYTLIKKDNEIIKKSKILKEKDIIDIVFVDGTRQAQIK